MRVEALFSKPASNAAEVVEIVAGRDDRSFLDLAQLRPQLVKARDAVSQQDGKWFGHG